MLGEVGSDRSTVVIVDSQAVLRRSPARPPRPSTKTISPPGSPTQPLPRASSMRVEDSRVGSSPETSYAIRTPSRIRSSSEPATFTPSDSSTPTSWTLVPDSLLVDREVFTVERAMPEDALGAMASDPAAESNMTIGPPPQP